MSIVIWENPPRGNRSKHNWGEFTRELMAHPGQWGRYPHPLPLSTCGNVMTGKIKAFTGEWEYTTRGVDGSDRRVFYARYVGPHAPREFYARVQYEDAQ